MSLARVRSASTSSSLAAFAPRSAFARNNASNTSPGVRGRSGAASGFVAGAPVAPLVTIDQGEGDYWVTARTLCPSG
jgi:hypothetical protein